MRTLLAFVCLVLGVGCHRPAESVPTTGSVAPTSVAPARTPQPAASTASRSPVPPTPSAASEKTKIEDDLLSEEREANPISETVTLTLTISPPVKAVVMWGAKQLARTAPDSPTVALERPRNSGPLDLEIRAEGFLPHHTRVHSDRNDKLSVHLVRPVDASSLLGFRSSTTAAAAKGKTK
jgi:hypothetical protein